MEAVINPVDDELVSSLQYKQPKTVMYNPERRDVSIGASGSDAYTQVGGTRVVRTNLNAEILLIPHTLMVVFTLNKKSGTIVRTIGNPLCFFQTNESYVLRSSYRRYY